MRWFWIDKFLEFKKGEYARSLKNVTLGEDHLHDHFPSYPVMPGSLIIEGMAQTGGILGGEATGFREKVVLAKIESARFHDVVKPGDQLVLETEIVEMREEGFKIRGRAYVDGKEVASANLMFVHLNSTNGNASDNFVFTEELLSMFNLQRVAR